MNKDDAGGSLSVGEQSMIDASLGIALVTDAAASSSVSGLDDGINFGAAGVDVAVADFLGRTQDILGCLVNNSESLAVTMANAAQDFTGYDLQAAAGLWKPLAGAG